MKVRNLLLGLAVVCLVVFALFPIGLLLFKSFEADGVWSLENYRRIFASSDNVKAITTTITISLLATLFSVALAVPFAFVLGRTDIPGKKLLRTLVMVPYMVPPFVGAIAWTYLASPRIGYLNRMVMTVPDKPLFNIYSLTGLVWVLGIFYLPRAFMGILRSFERLDPAMEEAGYVSGAGHGRVMRTITLPLLLPSILAGAFLVFIAVAATFGVPAIIGMPAKITVITTKVLQAIHVGSGQAIREGTALASILMGFAMIILAGNNLYLSRRDYTMVAGKASRSTQISLGRWRTPTFVLLLLISSILAVMPIAAILTTSFLRSVGLELFDASNWTLRNWQSVLNHPLTWRTLRTSILLSATSATIAVLVGGLIAYLRMRVPGKLAKLPDQLSALGSATPGTVVALGLIIAFSGGYGINLYGTVAILVVAYLVRNLALAVRTMVAAMQQLHPVLEEAAMASGAGWFRTVRDVTLPLLAPSLTASWFLVFIPSMYEVTMSVLLYSAQARPVGVYLYDLQSYADPQAAAVLSTILIVIVVGGNGLLTRLTGNKISL